MFHIKRKKSDSAIQKPNLIVKEKPKFVRSVSIARLFGNAYNTQLQQQQQHMSQNKDDIGASVKAKHLFTNRCGNGNNRSKIERFKHCTETQIDHMADEQNDKNKETNTITATTTSLPIGDFCDEKDLSTRAIRTLSKGIGMIWRRSYSVEISTPDPEYKVFYLGNVLTGWAKGKLTDISIPIHSFILSFDGLTIDKKNKVKNSASQNRCSILKPDIILFSK